MYKGPSPRNVLAGFEAAKAAYISARTAPVETCDEVQDGESCVPDTPYPHLRFAWMDVERHRDFLLNLPHGSHPSDGQFVDSALRATDPVVVLFKRVPRPEDNIQCILPPTLNKDRTGRVTSSPRVLSLRSGDGEEVIADRILAWIDGELGTSVSGVRPDQAAVHGILSQLYWPPTPPSKCLEVHGRPTEEEFLKFVTSSRPVVFKNAVDDGITQLNTSVVVEKAKGRRVHVKVAPAGDFEGPEDVMRWGGGGDIPPYVLKRLESPDRVVVRPASVDITMEELLSHLRNQSGEGEDPPSYYLEYSSVHQIAPEIADRVEVPSWASSLHREHTNLWIGGKTVGRLHFDPYENLMAVVSGEKRFTLFHPYANENLYEGHMREGELRYDSAQRRFLRTTLLDNT
eukprot:Sspe_Gene.24620::Locus_9787_Transcript_1_2_Confidence_1.000_Length_1222::g.24620::m.24620/K19219/JMJD7; jumonji domain-containing protein 7